MVELAKLLLLQRHRYSITILLSRGLLDHHSIDAYIHRNSTFHPSISFHHLPHTSPSTATGTASASAIAFDFIKRNTPHVAATVLMSEITIKAFIMDLFCASAIEAVSSMGIPVYFFFASCAASLALVSYLPRLHERASVSFKDMVGVELRVPGNAPLKAVNMPQPMLDREDPSYGEMLNLSAHLSEASGVLLNTFPALEPLAVKAACFPRLNLHYIGPLIAQPHHSDEATDSKECLSWLDEQPSKSVVYLCFGSRGSFSESQVREIANGLEKSGHRFLWVVKRPIQDEGTKQIHNDLTRDFDLGSVLPSGFMERTKDRGLVVKSWAPQVEVLSRDSVGAFVSHCGWNSVLEGVVAGVPMIAWPLYAEQHVNRNVMVGEMKVAVAVEQREEDGFVNGEEVEKRVREVMESEEIKERSLKLKHMALAALGESGSSTTALANLVESWSGTSA